MLSLTGAIITSLAVSVFIFPILIKYSQKNNFLDAPDRRRIHTRLTPSIGGVAIFVGFFISSIIWINVQWEELKIVLGILFIVFVLGLCDDLVHIKPSVKMLGQAIAGSLAFFLIDIKLESLYGLFNDQAFAFPISFAVSVFTIVIITNAFNLIDGIDGLAGSFASVSLVFFGTWFYLIGDLNYSILCFALLGAIIGFLIFNWEPSKIFMGDTGALLIGMVLSLLTIRFINVNYDLPASTSFRFNASISTALCVIVIPMVDTVRIIIIRLARGESPLKPDKRHIHHALVRLGLSHQSSVILLVLIHFLYLGIALYLKSYHDEFALSVVIVVSIFLNVILGYFITRRIKTE